MSLGRPDSKAQGSDLSLRLSDSKAQGSDLSLRASTGTQRRICKQVIPTQDYTSDSSEEDLSEEIAALEDAKRQCELWDLMIDSCDET